jgi:hypothetical protein
MTPLKRLSGLLGLALGFSTFLRADALIDFLVFPPSSAGLISYAGGSAPLVGSSIPIAGVSGMQTPQNSGAFLPCTACVLNFTTGAFASSASNVWTFYNGGSLDLTGTVDLGGGNQATGTLLSGYFGATQPTVTAFGNSFNIAGAAFATQVNSSLANYFGTPTAPFMYLGNFNISFTTPGSVLPPNAFASNMVLSGDVVAQTPEPMSVILLGTTLVLCGGVGRRWIRALQR